MSAWHLALSPVLVVSTHDKRLYIAAVQLVPGAATGSATKPFAEVAHREPSGWFRRVLRDL
jgi:hypothetical protein